MYLALRTMPSTPLAVRQELAAVLRPEAIRAASAADSVCGVPPDLVLEPASEAELAAALCLANDANLAVIPRGGGTKLAWGNSPKRADIVLSTARLNKIIEHVWSDLTVSVEAGCTVHTLQTALAQHGQRLAIDPLWPERATIGGLLSTNDSGTLRLRYGSLRDLVLGVTLALPDGTLASSGGKVVKNVAGYDLPKLVTGALGTLAVITRAVFRLHPLPHRSKTLTLTPRDLRTMQKLLSNVQDSHFAHTALQARTAHNAEPAVDILFDGTEAGIAAQEEQLRKIAGATRVNQAAPSVWESAREQWTMPDAQDGAGSVAIAKITALPAAVADAVGRIARSSALHGARWQLTMQATGIGSLRLDGPPENLRTVLAALREELQRAAGSLVLLHRPAELLSMDTWGEPGDALPLMRALKMQFDPRNTLNPGRFAGGI